MKLSVVIPCFNEETYIPALLEEFKQLGFSNGGAYELVLVNNGSTDNSAEILKEAQDEYSFLTVVTVAQNIGYGDGIVQGLKRAEGDYLAWMSADMLTSPGEIPEIYSQMRKKKNAKKILAKGCRKHRPFIELIFTWGMNVFESLYFKQAMSDINGHPVVFHRSFMELWKNPPTDFALDLYVYVIALQNGYKVCRYPVRQHPRKWGESSWNKGFSSRLRLSMNLIKSSIKVKRGIRTDYGR